MIIGGLQKTTLIDYPGKVACTVFLAGCNFRCPFCYSAELVLPEKIKKQPRLSEEKFFAFLKKRKGLLDGVVICGGEATINAELPKFIKKIKGLGFLVKLDTNGSNPEMLAKLIKQRLINYLAMDVKAPLNKEKYAQAAGCPVNLEKIRQSIAVVKSSGLDYEFRTTIAPGIHADQDIIDIVKSLAPARAYYLQGFRPEKTIKAELEKIKPYPLARLQAIKDQVKDFFQICNIR